ncbi:GntR family transcriptional regulator [Egibacter rhizosphaerae]|uniref:GntR family transcriptional regulator n=1 Tax=Egibacter rhizosphaerae TaxID=1670831 RepID=UPI0013F156DB|nr:GntR family transcriptional regulator [Egibacter rhizosphaerae]
MTDRVYEVLKTRILELTLPPDTRLQVGKIAEEFDVSATPVREALNRLAAEHLVAGAAYRGFSVSPVLGRQELVQLLQARLVVERAAASRAAEVRDEAALERLGELVTRMEKLVDAPVLDVMAFNAADQAFHQGVVEASGNPFLVQAFDSLHVHVQIARFYEGESGGHGQHANVEHQRLLKALVSGDAEAAAAEVDTHIADVFGRLEAEIAAGEESTTGPRAGQPAPQT